jgi:VWFA-related protein
MNSLARFPGSRAQILLGFALAGILAYPNPFLAQTGNQAEITTQESTPSFKFEVQRNMVVVRAVIRDPNGRPVSGLQKEDFRLLDNGKPQVISQFAVETPSTPTETEAKPARVPSEEEAALEPPPSVLHNYLALYFDDLQMAFDEVVRARDAAERYLNTGLRRDDRVGIFTTSGQTVVDFTDDRAALHQALSRIRNRPLLDMDNPGCHAEIGDYQAYLMVHERDQYAISIAEEELFHCNCDFLPPQMRPDCRMRAHDQVEGEAVQILDRFATRWQMQLRGIEQLIRRMSVLPGRRSIIYISPGFLDNNVRMQISSIVDRALRDNVVINGLDPRGLYTIIPYGDASKQPVLTPDKPILMGKKQQIIIDGITRYAEVMKIFSHDTGGQYFHNSNDLNEGFRQIGSLETVYYVLAYSPDNLKMDGRFHNISVTLANARGMTVQARRGYFAPSQSDDPAKRVKEEIQQVVFSHEEMNELPVEVHTQFFKVSDTDARLSVLARLDIRLLHFRKEEGRNLNLLTFVTAIFDRDGKFIAAREKLLDLHLHDGSLDELLKTGLTTKTSFDIKPGTYLVRQVVRDAEGGQMSSLNRTVEIPY